MEARNVDQKAARPSPPPQRSALLHSVEGQLLTRWTRMLTMDARNMSSIGCLSRDCYRRLSYLLLRRVVDRVPWMMVDVVIPTEDIFASYVEKKSK